MITVFTVLFAVIFFILGSVVGSFLNVIAYRMPIKESLVKGRSHCTTCGKQILNRDLIPIFSWIFLGGKCRYCKEKISPRYMIVELLTALSYLGAFLVFGFTVKLAFAAVLFPVLMVLSLWDID
ncbi:MAG: prepilin peptidase, partial [[Eubacterium] siraeum]|nr:prepilin peptidase [[Eubacterium] siraeum]